MALLSGYWRNPLTSRIFRRSKQRKYRFRRRAATVAQHFTGGLVVKKWIVTFVALLLSISAAWAVPEDSSNVMIEKNHLEWLGAPYVSADSDNGITLGLGTQVRYGPRMALIINTSVSTENLAGLTVRGEAASDRYKHIIRTTLWKMPIKLYPVAGASPDWHTKSLLQHTELQWATLRRFSPHFEFGPEIWSDFAKGIAPEDPYGMSVPVSALPRLRDGSLVLAGLRMRYRTTSAVRPLDGIIFDWALRAGRADGIEFTTPKPTVTSDLWLGYALPITDKLRLYSRFWGRYQMEAANSVRNPIGGLYTLRGQPFSRDFGRRMISGRFQLHYTAFEHVRFIGKTLHKIIPFVPEWDLEFEMAPFADIGAVGDPDWGKWRKTRQGYGMSFRIVLPPELVLFFDLAVSPGGTPLYYFGGGESI